MSTHLFSLQGASVATSLDDYDKLFDAHNSFEEQQRSASSHRLPIGNEGYEAPVPYDRTPQQLDVTGELFLLE